jgi:hypothetical protein
MRCQHLNRSNVFMNKSPLILATLFTVAMPFSLSAATVYWEGNDINPGAGDTPTGA